jgi:anti-sigma factor RsiW
MSNTTPSHQEMQELLAAYALDAVEGEEGQAVELHLRECPRCRAEVVEHRETACLLAGGHAPAPVDIWDSIAALLDEEQRPAAPISIMSKTPAWRRRTRVAVASMAAAAIALLGVRVVEQDRRLDQVQGEVGDRTLLSSALAAQARPDARQVDLRSGDGPVLARAVITPEGTGFVWSDGLPEVASDRTYQLWAVVEGKTISAGVLGADPGVVPFPMAGDVMGLAITEEPAGGVVSTTNQPVAAGLLQEA